MAALIDAIDQIAATVRRGGAGSEKAWGGAEVIICRKAPDRPTDNSESSEGFQKPDKRYVETKYVEQLSWLFTRCRDIFNKQDGYGLWKEELFGRLGNVANKFQAAVPNASSIQVLEAVIHEAYAMAEEISDYGAIETMLVSSNNSILDDYLGTSDLSAYLSSEETLEFLRKKGLA
jgi:hypothetical protein